MSKVAMTEQAKEARREYKRKWARENRDKVRQAQVRYWERKAAQQVEKNTADVKEGSGVEAEAAYKLELHIWLDSKDEFEKSRDRLQRGLKKYPGDCGIILFSRDSKEYMELPECQFDHKHPELVEAIAHTFGNFNVDVVTRVSCRPAI